MKIDKLERYRPSMDDEVLRSWAEDAQEKLDEAMKIIASIASANPDEMLCRGDINQAKYWLDGMKPQDLDPKVEEIQSILSSYMDVEISKGMILNIFRDNDTFKYIHVDEFNDTMYREIIVDTFTLATIGMRCPMYGSPEEYKKKFTEKWDEFIKRLEGEA